MNSEQDISLPLSLSHVSQNVQLSLSLMVEEMCHWQLVTSVQVTVFVYLLVRAEW